MYDRQIGIDVLARLFHVGVLQRMLHVERKLPTQFDKGQEALGQIEHRVSDQLGRGKGSDVVGRVVEIPWDEIASPLCSIFLEGEFGVVRGVGKDGDVGKDAGHHAHCSHRP